MKKELNKKERLFVLEYINDDKMNAEQAALKAGYSSSVARSKAYVWVSKSKQNDKPHIAEVIEVLLQKRLEKLEITGEKIVGEVAKIAFFDIAKLVEKLGEKDNLTLADLKNIKSDLLTGVSEISIEDGVVKIKMPWKMKALELLGKKFKIWEGSSDEGVKYVVEVVRK